MVQSKQKWQYRTIDGKDEINSEIVVFRIETCQDIYDINVVVNDWASLTEIGKWVSNHAVTPIRWEQWYDIMNDINKIAIIARLSEQNQVLFKLKFE